MMALSRKIEETGQARAARDPRFRRELLREGVQCLLSGDLDTGKTVLRDYRAPLKIPLPALIG